MLRFEQTGTPPPGLPHRPAMATGNDDAVVPFLAGPESPKTPTAKVVPLSAVAPSATSITQEQKQDPEEKQGPDIAPRATRECACHR